MKLHRLQPASLLRIWFPCLLAACLLAGCASPNGPTPVPPGGTSTGVLDQAAFADAMHACLEETTQAYTFVKGEAYSILIQSGENDDFTMYTDNAYAEYLKNPDALEDILLTYSQSSLSALQQRDIPLEQGSILPMLKYATYVQDLGEVGEAMLYEDYAGLMQIVYAQDTPLSVRMLQQEDLEEAGIARAELKDIALANMQPLLEGLSIYEKDGIFYIYLEEAVYTASLLLMDIWDRKHFPVDGDIIVGVPERDALIVVGSNDETAVSLLRSLCNSAYAAAGYPVYEGLLKWNGAAFEAY